MDDSEAARARQKTAWLKIELNQQERDIKALVRRISQLPSISAKQLDNFIAEAIRLHRSFSFSWSKLENNPEVYKSMLEEPTAEVEKLLRNLEDRLNTLYRKMHDGRSLDFPPFPDTRQAKQSEEQPKTNSPLLRGPQDPGSPSTGQGPSKGIGH